MVEGINLLPGPSVRMTTEIIAVVGCQRAAPYTAILLSPVAFLASEEACFITGSELFVDGGMAQV
jgi:NAD(P)-dependent dehydrogenase (short-subunit alcohol dehydrogenase family)